MNTTKTITPDDIRSKLTELQDDVQGGVEGAKDQLIAGAAALMVILLILSFVLGRRGGKRASTVIEVRRGF